MSILSANIHDLGATVAGILGFGLFLLPPGYIFSFVADLQGFRAMRRGEQFLWSLALSVPLAVLISNLLGRVVPSSAVLCVFYAIGASAFAVAAGPGRAFSRSLTTDPTRRRQLWVALAVVVLLALWMLFALLDIHIGTRLFVPTTLYDWSVRVPMVRSGIGDPHVPPTNPLASLHGETNPLRYYYFWSVLCGTAAHALHLSAHNILAASCVWSLFALLSVLLLALRYLVPRAGNAPGHALLWGMLLIVPFATIGLDILPTLAILLHHSGHPYLDMEWWRNDRSPAFLTSVLSSPHHIAGMACNLLGFLILATTRRDGTAGERDLPAGQLALRGLTAGLCFGACAGTSTWGSLVFALACILWAADLVRLRQWRRVGMLAGIGIVAYLTARPFLHDLRTETSAAGGLFTLAWRSNQYAHLHLAKIHALAAHPAIMAISQQLLVLVLDFFELGFFFFVLVDRFRQDFASGARKLHAEQRALWAVLLAAGIAALFFNSGVTQSANDLGMNAGSTVRLVLVLWSVPWLGAVWQNRHHLRRASPGHRVWIGSALACLVLGLAGQAYGMVMNRLYFPLIESRVLDRPIDVMTADRLSYRLEDIRDAYAFLGLNLKSNAHVQYDPVGTMEPAMSYFANRQLAAQDFGCGTAFGGNHKACAAVEAQLAALYGSNAQPQWINSVAVYDRAQHVPNGMDMRTVCRDLRLSALLAESTDFSWSMPGSWVWTERPIYANGTVRVFSCN